jgi:uncharacterized protein Smg (DUF494 family)
MGKVTNSYKILVGKPEVIPLLGRPLRRLEDNINIDIEEIRCKDMDWIQLALYRAQWWALVYVTMNLLLYPNRTTQK